MPSARGPLYSAPLYSTPPCAVHVTIYYTTRKRKGGKKGQEKMCGRRMGQDREKKLSAHDGIVRERDVSCWTEPATNGDVGWSARAPLDDKDSDNHHRSLITLTENFGLGKTRPSWARAHTHTHTRHKSVTINH